MEKKRHGCLLAWLILAIVGNAAIAVMYLFMGDMIKQGLPNAPDWVLPVLIVFSIFNLVCAIALFKWKKWGFWGFVGSTIAALMINMYIGVSVQQSLMGLLGIVILYIALQIGKENKGWTQLD